MIDPSRWYPPNHAEILRFLTRMQTDRRRRTAVFDWDDTTIFRCLGTATFRFALHTLDIRLGPERLAEVVRGDYGGFTHTAAGVPFAALAADALAAWETLWPLVRAGQSQRAVAAFPAEHQRFRAIVGAFYPLLEETAGPPFAYPFLVEVLGNRSAGAFEALAAEAWRAARDEPVAPVVWRTPDAGRCGPVTATFEGGIALYDEMADLARALTAVGVEVHIVTASAEYAIRAGAALNRFPVPGERIHGVRLIRDDATLTHRSPEDWPLTWRAGKVEVIRRMLPEEPIFVAGDTNTDFEMLTAFDATELRLVINRGQRGPITALYDAALRPESSPLRGITLLQGRDEPAACFRPSQGSIALSPAGPG